MMICTDNLPINQNCLDRFIAFRGSIQSMKSCLGLFTITLIVSPWLSKDSTASLDNIIVDDGLDSLRASCGRNFFTLSTNVLAWHVDKNNINEQDNILNMHEMFILVEISTGDIIGANATV